METKHKKIMILIVILSIIVVGLGGYIVYDKIFKESKETKNIINNTQEDKQNTEFIKTKIKGNSQKYSLKDIGCESSFNCNKEITTIDGNVITMLTKKNEEEGPRCDVAFEIIISGKINKVINVECFNDFYVIGENIPTHEYYYAVAEHTTGGGAIDNLLIFDSDFDQIESKIISDTYQYFFGKNIETDDLVVTYYIDSSYIDDNYSSKRNYIEHIDKITSSGLVNIFKEKSWIVNEGQK